MVSPVPSRPDIPADYGIAPADGGKGLLPWSWADERLTGRYIWWLSTTRPDGRPHLMPVWAVWLGDCVGFSTGSGTTKAKNLAQNKFVTIVPERGTQSVIVEGEVGELPADRLRQFFDTYKAVYDTDVEEMGEPVHAIWPSKVFGFIDEEDGFPLNATRWTF